MFIIMINFLQMTAIYILLGWGVYINYRMGQLYYGNVPMMAIGAYVSAFIVVNIGWPHWLAILIAFGVGMLISFIIALGLARAEAFGTAIATMGLLFIVQTIIRNLELVGAMYGLINIPKVSYLPLVTWATVFIVGFIIYKIDRCRLGRAMETSFVDRDLADTLGINRYWLGVFSQTFAGTIGALAGCYYAFTIAALRPDHFNFAILLRLIAFVFIGGAQTMWGVVFFTPILWGIAAFVPSEIAAWREMIFGVLLIVILLIRPEGIIDRQLIRVINNKIRQFQGREPIGL